MRQSTETGNHRSLSTYTRQSHLLKLSMAQRHKPLPDLPETVSVA